MPAVFEQVTLWRGTFSPATPFVVALDGTAGADPLDPVVIERNGRHVSGGAPLANAAGARGHASVLRRGTCRRPTD